VAKREITVEMIRKSLSSWSRSAWILLLIVLVGAVLRLYRLDAQSFWGDEAFSALIAASSSAQVLGNAFASVHPPGYYFLLYLWRSVAGGTDLALRYPSTLLGVLGIVLTYQLGRNIRSKHLGLWAAGITTLAPYHVFYSQEARMYSLLYCLACVIMLAYIRLWRGGGLGWWTAFVLASAAGLWTHFFAGFVIAVVGGHFCLLRLWRTDSGRPPPWRISTGKASPGWCGFFIANAVIALTFGLYLPRFVGQTQIVDTETWRVPPSLGELVGLPLALAISQFLSGVWQMVAFGCVTFLVIIVGLQVARALWQRAPASDWLLLLALLFLVPVATSFVVSQFWKLIFLARVLIVVVPAFYLLIAWGAAHTRERRFNQLVLLLLLPQVILGLYHWFFVPSYAKPPVRDAAHLVRESELADAPVIHAVATSYKIFAHYAPDLDNRLLSGSPMSLQPDEVYERMGGEVINPAAIPGDCFWFVVFPIHSHEFQFAMRDDFDVRFQRQQEWDVSGIQIIYYVRVDS
jgi:4-amino-4-deoxy-L-arabinose transferase-like glycosyltransferase